MSTFIMIKRNKPYYSKRQIHNLIRKGNFFVSETARGNAKKAFGWSIKDIKKAILSLNQNQCYNSQQRFDNPEVWVDYYRAYNLMGENVYTHFHVIDDMLIIQSFKEI